MRARLDAVSAPQLRRALDDARSAGADEVRIDLSDVTFIDSSGLQAITAALRELRDEGRDLRGGGQPSGAADLRGHRAAQPPAHGLSGPGVAAAAGPDVGPRRAWAPVVVVLVEAIGVALLATSAYQVQRTAERDQLRQRAAEASTALEAVLPVFGVPLASAVAVVDETEGDLGAFERVIGGFVGDQGLASSGALWRTGEDDPEPVIELGRPSQLAAATPTERARTIDEAPVGVLGIVDLTDRPVRAISFTLASANADADGTRSPTSRSCCPTTRRPSTSRRRLRRPRFGHLPRRPGARAPCSPPRPATFRCAMRSRWSCRGATESCCCSSCPVAGSSAAC
ncbi:MAG: STAS domain-containing protein [Acidimicrobiales bacterium]